MEHELFVPFDAYLPNVSYSKQQMKMRSAVPETSASSSYALLRRKSVIHSVPRQDYSDVRYSPDKLYNNVCLFKNVSGVVANGHSFLLLQDRRTICMEAK
jgi:hypothetical protein